MSTEEISIKQLPAVTEINNNDLLLVQTPTATNTLKFEDFVVGLENTTFAPLYALILLILIFLVVLLIGFSLNLKIYLMVLIYLLIMLPVLHYLLLILLHYQL